MNLIVVDITLRITSAGIFLQSWQSWTRLQVPSFDAEPFLDRLVPKLDWDNIALSRSSSVNGGVNEAVEEPLTSVELTTAIAPVNIKTQDILEYNILKKRNQEKTSFPVLFVSFPV